MPRRAALLGSINVGGNRLAMTGLKVALEDHGFSDVETVVASGNVLFAHDNANDAELAGEIVRVLADRFGIASTVVVRSRQELIAALGESPFGDSEDKAVHIHFLTGQPTPEQFARLFADHAAGNGAERLAAGDRALHIDFAAGVAGSKLTGAFIDRRLGMKGTARNRRSLLRVVERLSR